MQDSCSLGCYDRNNEVTEEEPGKGLESRKSTRSSREENQGFVHSMKLCTGSANVDWEVDREESLEPRPCPGVS